MATKSRPNIQINNLVREMTEEEFEDYKLEQIKNAEQKAELEAKAAARASALAKLADLGLTEAEINAL
jgi:uncharacterized protein YjiS (DUF1127 family)